MQIRCLLPSVKYLMLGSKLLKIETPESWEAIYSPSVSMPELDTIEKINSWVNSNIKYVGDEKDYWQNAKETLDRKEGDCEDIAILKLKLLENLGLEPSLLICRDLVSRCAHAVVVIDGMILDNFTSHVLSEKEYQGILSPIYVLKGREKFICGS